MKPYEYIEQATLKLLSSDDGFFPTDDVATKLMGRPRPDYNTDPLGFILWKWEASGRFAHQCASAYHAGVKAENDRFEV